jgi:UDP-N-acetylglucosamine diphosphorylase/glucosamine-1-phosphate N-acetyltransferase
MHITLFDDDIIRNNLLPITFTRPVADLRIGTFTIAQKWEKYFNCNIGFLTQPYLQALFPANHATNTTYINGAVLPTQQLFDAISNLKSSEKLIQNDTIIAYKNLEDIEKLTPIPLKDKVEIIHQLWDIFSLNEYGIEQDFNWFLHNAQRTQLAACSQATQPDNIFVEVGALTSMATFNPQHKKIILRKNSEVMEGVNVRGAFALGEDASIKMGAKIYGATTVGDGCKAAGELSNVVMHSNSNKAHDGFLGNAVIGAWCNLGADTNNSNLKNNYEEVKLWNYPLQKFIKTGLQFCGLIMADHVKCGINTMFNTGTVVGVSANIFGSGFPRNTLPDFSWGGPQGMTTYRIDDALNTMVKVLARRKIVLSNHEIAMYKHIFEITKSSRNA